MNFGFKAFEVPKPLAAIPMMTLINQAMNAHRRWHGEFLKAKLVRIIEEMERFGYVRRGWRGGTTVTFMGEVYDLALRSR